MGPNVSTICETHCVQNIAYFSSFTYACAFIFNKDTSLVHFFHFNSHFKEFLYFETWNKKGTPKHMCLETDPGPLLTYMTKLIPIIIKNWKLFLIIAEGSTPSVVSYSSAKSSRSASVS